MVKALEIKVILKPYVPFMDMGKSDLVADILYKIMKLVWVEEMFDLTFNVIEVEDQ